MNDKQVREINKSLARVAAARRMAKKTGRNFRDCLNVGDRVLTQYGLNLGA